MKNKTNPSPDIFGAVVHRFGDVESTNDLAFELAADGAAEGTAVVAEGQRRGRGRQGREWISPTGLNLYCSFILRPARIIREWVDLPWVVAAAAGKILLEEGAEDVTIKNPNDLLVSGRKIAGVLLENRQCGGSSTAVVAGVGFNVNMGYQDFPEDLRPAATSLRLLTGRTADREVLFGQLCRNLSGLYGTWTSSGAGAVREIILRGGIRFAGFEKNGATFDGRD